MTDPHGDHEREPLEDEERGRPDDGPAAEPEPEDAEPEKPPPQDLKLSLNREENPDVIVP